MGIVETIALTMGVAWASGINLYAAIATLGLLGATGNIALPPDLEILMDPLVIGAAGFMYFVEFFADKTPGVDSGWDTIHTFIRIPAGAVLAAGAVGELGAGAELAAAIAGGTLAGATHFTKAGTRLAINTSPEPVSNWTASFVEDIAVIGGLWMALNHPMLFLGMLAAFILLMIWLLPKIWRALRTIYARLRQWTGGGKPDPTGTSASAGTGGGTDVVPGQGFSLSLKPDDPGKS
ncbi:MAG: DUF4126 domain-containing protein [Alphaproteobacteria bacterium]|nr:DUF4126 domain-containing protein [Alphaproteobacteria bacterium]